MRILATALVALLMSGGIAAAQLAPTRPGTAAPPSTAVPATPVPRSAPGTPGQHPDQFAAEGDAKAHCGSSQTVVWLNTSSGIYHWPGTRDYGHTKNGAYMCQRDADKVGRAAKNEKPPAR